MADIPADPYGGDPMLRWFFEQQAMGAPAPMEPTASPLDFSAAPVPTEIAGPAGPSLPVPTDALAAPPPVETPALIDWAQGIPTEYAGLGPSPTGPDPLGAPPDAAVPPPDYQGFGPSPTPPLPPPVEHTGLGPALGAIGVPLPSAAIAEHIGYNAGEFSNADPMRRRAYLEDVAAKDPARFAQIQEAHKQIGEEEARAAQLDAARLNTQRAEANFKALNESRAHALRETEALVAESKKLADTGIDRGRVWSRKSTGGKIASVLLAVVGGLVASRKGGPNTGLQMIMKEIDDDVEDQKAQIAMKQAELGRRSTLASQAVSQAADAYRLGEVHRAAAYETVLREIEARRASFDPRGTQDLRLAQLGQEVRSAQAREIQAFTERTQKTEFDQKIKAAEIGLKVAELDQKQAAAAARASMGGGGGGSAAPAGGIDEKAVLTPDQLVQLYSTPDSPAPRPPVSMSVKEYGPWLKTVGEVGEQAKKKWDQGQEQRKVERERSDLPLFTADGQRIAFVPKGSDADVQKLRAKATATREVVDLLDHAMSIRTGWTSDAVKSDENVRLHADFEKAKAKIKDLEQLGAITASDVPILEGLLGTKDFTSWRGVTSGVAQARENILKSVRNEAVGLGMDMATAAKIDVPNIHKSGPKSTPEDADLAFVLGDIGKSGLSRGKKGVSDERQAEEIERAKTIINAWSTKLASGDAKAVSAIGRVAREAQNLDVRNYAAQLLQNSVNKDVQSTGGFGGGTGLTWQP